MNPKSALTNSSSANASENGWSFEYAAALFIYFEYIEQTKALGIEKGNDIQIVLKNGKSIFAQAKSSLSPDSINAPHLKELSDCIKTFQDDEKRNPDSFISIFNYHRPFGIHGTFNPESFNDRKRFIDLNSEEKEVLQKKINGKYQVDLNKVKFWFLRFEGEQPIQSLKDYLRSKLSFVNGLDTDSLLDTYLMLIIENGKSTDTMVKNDVMLGVLFERVIKTIGYDALKTTAGIETTFAEDLEAEEIYEAFASFANSISFYSSVSSGLFLYAAKEECAALSTQDVYKKFIDYYCKSEETPSFIKVAVTNRHPLDSSRYEDIIFRVFTAAICRKANIIKVLKENFKYADR